MLHKPVVAAETSFKGISNAGLLSTSKLKTESKGKTCTVYNNYSMCASVTSENKQDIKKTNL